MTSEFENSLWQDCRDNAVESVKEAFQSLPPRYYLAAALFLPLAIPAWACRLAFHWAADRFAAQMPLPVRANTVELESYSTTTAPLCGQVPQKA